MSNCYAFIDGAYVRASLDSLKTDWKELNLWQLAQVGLTSIMPTVRLRPHRVFVYDAVRDDRSQDNEAEAVVRAWLERNAWLPDTHVRYGTLTGQQSNRPRQKGVDVQLAVDALTGAFRQHFSVGLLIAGDADFVPVVQAVRDAGPTIGVATFNLPANSEKLLVSADRRGEFPSSYDFSSLKLPQRRS